MGGLPAMMKWAAAAFFAANCGTATWPFLLAVPSNTLVRDLEAEPPTYTGRGVKPKTPFRRVDQWCGSLPEDAWTTIEVRDGEKGRWSSRS